MTTTTIPQELTIHQCEHCGLEHDAGHKGECNRCGRTFLVTRRVCNPAWVRERDLANTRLKAEELRAESDRKEKRRKEIERLKETGWYGCRIYTGRERDDLVSRLTNENA